jgi:hypothetical protein
MNLLLKNRTLLVKVFVILFLLVIFIINFFISLKSPDLFTRHKKDLFSLNRGESYFGRLNFWRLLVQNNDWVNAAKLESRLSSSEISDYKFNYQPVELEKKESLLNSKEEKSVEDFIELARIQLLLDKKSNSLDNIQKARQLDPLRDDIDRLYYSLSK